MWGNSSRCGRGLSALSGRGLTAEVDKSLEISFKDPQGLYAELCKLQNRYAFHGICDFKTSWKDKNPKIPTLFIDDKYMGTINNLDVEDIKALAEPSPFGRGSQTVYDENVRKASEIKASRMDLEMVFPREIQNLAPTGYKIVPKLYKLAIYEKDGFFAEHSDTVHAENHIGTLVMCLPIPHKGGTFILSDGGNELKLAFDEMIKGDRIPWVAFYTDVKHKVEVVKKGMRMTLQFDLMAEKAVSGDEDGIIKRLRGNHYAFGDNKYRFHDYNEEGVEVIKNKIALTLGQEVKKPKEEEEEDKDKSSKPGSKKVMMKRDRPDDDKPLEVKTTKQMKVEESEEPESDEDQDESEQFEKKLTLSDSKEEVPIPDGVAILLKRRYDAITLSLDRLKGSDEILYQALKDDFRIEVKHLILEQNTDYEGKYKGEPIQIVALGQIDETEDACSSEEEELGFDPDHKKVPSEPGELREQREKKEKKGKKGKKEEEIKVKKVYLVSGFSSKCMTDLVREDYEEFTGNESQAGCYAYMHAALFIYPKVKK